MVFVKKVYEYEVSQKVGTDVWLELKFDYFPKTKDGMVYLRVEKITEKWGANELLDFKEILDGGNFFKSAKVFLKVAKKLDSIKTYQELKEYLKSL